mmetsp:Transcript_22983/g.54232  ORF Transcript_22983/g.54232 Transcript_22983/m.54232 type:complete len:1053 (+) Transcript_22983:227-3385(+)
MNENEMATTRSQRVIDVEDHNKRSRRLSYHLDSLLGGGIGSDRDDAELAAAEDQFSPDEIKLAFEVYEQERSRSAERDEFESIERFIASEKKQGYKEREAGRRLAASEEIRLASQIAEIKGFRSRASNQNAEVSLRNRMSDMEKAYIARKLVVVKASQVTSADCRRQFTRVKQFFEKIHLSRQKSLRDSYERSMKVLKMMHRIRDCDSRLAEIELQSAERMYQVKVANLNQLHMAQNLEESGYLEQMFLLLDKVSAAKEAAASDLFQHDMEEARSLKELNVRLDGELEKARADATIELAKMVAHYVQEQSVELEEDKDKHDDISATERAKDFRESSVNPIATVSELYDTIIWSVVTSRLGTDSSASLFSSSNGSYSDIEEEEKEERRVAENTDPEPFQRSGGCDAEDDGKSMDQSMQSGSSSNTTAHEDVSIVGKMYIKQLKRDLMQKESALLDRQKAERKEERRRQRKAKSELVAKHNQIIETLLSDCVNERHRLRYAISERMHLLARSQRSEELTLQESIDEDIKAMQSTWEEHKRLEEMEKASFDKAQALVSAQVYHEIRNALSSVIAMGEMTKALRQDPSTSSKGLISSVDDMMDQTSEVVRYSLTMLNNILDINKIKTGSFNINPTRFNLTELVQRATTMQVVKAQTKGVKMTFNTTSSVHPVYTSTDKDIVLRIITNFISNSVKFTKSGCVQPFVIPVEEMAIAMPELKSLGDYVCVGVADTGIGLSAEQLEKAKLGLYNSESTVENNAKNSGFGLHLAHQLAEALGTRLYLGSVADFKDILGEDTLGEDPKAGTVLFIAVPVAASHRRGSGDQIMKRVSRRSSLGGEGDYRFHPKGSCFRILVADDVTMLRKGLCRSMLQVFEPYTECRIEIHTACTAEDALRMIKLVRFDIVFLDNQFVTPQTNRAMPTAEDMPRITLEAGRTAGETKVTSLVSEYFHKEPLQIKEGDGQLSGLQALLQVADDDSFQPKPVLVLLSGHKFDLENQCNMLVVQKPLQTREIIPFLEANAKKLVESGMCFEEVDEKGIARVRNMNGNELFHCNILK